MAPTEAPRRPSEARERLLRTAGAIFYAKGVHSVGVDELLTRAQVTRATLYRHFGGKEDLIVEYIRTADRQIREGVAAATADLGAPESGVRVLAGLIADQIVGTGFRGCAFLNVAAEYPDPGSPVRRAVAEHRDWFFGTVLQQFTRVTDAPEPAAQQFVMLRDGAMAAGCLGDPERVAQTFLRGVDGILAGCREPGPAAGPRDGFTKSRHRDTHGC